MKDKELGRWFSSNVYDKDDREISEILKLGKVENKDVLMLGSYGVLHIAFKLLRYAKSITAIHESRNIINYCKKKKTKIDFRFGKISKTDYPKDYFDVIVSPWGGLHYSRSKAKSIKEFNRILKNNGILLIEEADESSEYVKILNSLSPNRKAKIKIKRNELKEMLMKLFDVREKKLTTYYDFKNKRQCVEYFKKEIVLEEKKKFTKEMTYKIQDYLSAKDTLRIEEKSIFFVCRKKNS